MKREAAIRTMRANLLRRREVIRQSLNLTRAQLHARSQQEVGDRCDQALDAEYQDVHSQLAEAESTEIAQIDVALERMATGEYGRCEACDRTIPLARLQALPYAALCIRCQREQETTEMPHDNSTLWSNSGEHPVTIQGAGVP